MNSPYPHLWMPYALKSARPAPLPVARTEPFHLILEDGRRLIDGVASWWTACHGYNHPHLIAKVKAQLEQMPHVMLGGIHHEPAVTLAERLAQILPGDLNHVFFSDSGSVAVEVAMKIALQFWKNQGFANRTRFVCFAHAYHGDTLGAMSLGDPERSMHASFPSILAPRDCHPIPRTLEAAEDLSDWLETHRAEIAAVFLEPLVQGAGGMRFHSVESLGWIASACQRAGILLVADEIATGFGRTGSMFACEQAGVVPDMICLGKGLTGGMLGMAATVVTPRVFEPFWSDDPAHILMHGPTYMANPLACAAANASLDLFETEPRVAQGAALETQLMTGLSPCVELPGVVEVRAKGGVGVVQVERLVRLSELRQGLLDRGVWVRPFADIIYLTPALNIPRSILQELCQATVDAIQDWTHHRSGKGRENSVSNRREP